MSIISLHHELSNITQLSVGVDEAASSCLCFHSPEIATSCFDMLS